MTKKNMTNKMTEPDEREPWQKQYGDIYRLDAYPLMDDPDGHSEPVLEQRDAFDSPEGRVRRYWRVVGNNGLGQLSERSIYLALLVMTAEAGWASSDIDFTFRTLALRSAMQPGPKAYEKIADALDRLKNLLVTFQGTTETLGQDAHGITITFYVIASLYKVTSEEEVECTVSWSGELYKALRSAVQECQAASPELSLEQIMSQFLTPCAPEQTRPLEMRPTRTEPVQASLEEREQTV